jgi:hypothetical protein
VCLYLFLIFLLPLLLHLLFHLSLVDIATLFLCGGDLRKTKYIK